MYGLNNIHNMTFDEADNLLYAAEKYQMKPLKDDLAERLMKLLNSQNICILLNNPACHTKFELDAKISEILQYETDAVFACNQFEYLRHEGFKKILEQDALNVSEVDVWKAALKWAKLRVDEEVNKEPEEGSPLHSEKRKTTNSEKASPNKDNQKKLVEESKNNAGCGDWKILRKYFSQLKYIRIRTFGLTDFCREIAPSNVLSPEEISKMVVAFGKNEHPPAIEGFTDTTKARSELKSDKIEIAVSGSQNMSETSFKIIVTKSSAVTLLPLEFQTIAQSSSETYQFDCTIEVTRDSATLPEVTVRFNELVECGKILKVPVENNGRYVKLLPNSSYSFKITLNVPHPMISTSQSTYSCLEFTLKATNKISQNNYSYSSSSQYSNYYPFKSLKYVKSPTK